MKTEEFNQIIGGSGEFTKLIKLRNAKVTADKLYKHHMNKITKKLIASVKQGDPLKVLQDGVTWEFVLSTYHNRVIFRKAIKQ